MDRRPASRGPATRGGAQAGLSYVEVLVATVLVVVALVPALNALQTGIAGSTVHQVEAARLNSLRSKMEEVLAKPFNTLYAQTYLSGNSDTTPSAAFSDPAVVDRRIVVLYRYDGSAATAADSGLLRIRVAFEAGGAGLETLRGRWW